MIRFSGHRPANRTQSPAVPRPLSFNYVARIVDCGDRPLILLHDHCGGTWLDLVIGREEERLRLAARGSISVRRVIAPAALDISGAMPYWGGPGRGLWEAVAARLSAAVWEEVKSHRGRRLTRDQSSQLLHELFKEAGQDGVVIAGKSIPFNLQAPWIPLDLSSLAFLELSFVTEQAWPRGGCAGAIEPHIMIRVFTAAEWAALTVHPGIGLPNAAAARRDTPRGPSLKIPKRQSEAKTRRDFQAFLDQREPGNKPSQRESDEWAKAHNFTTTVVRELHRELVARTRGRPKKLYAK